MDGKTRKTDLEELSKGLFPGKTGKKIINPRHQAMPVSKSYTAVRRSGRAYRKFRTEDGDDASLSEELTGSIMELDGIVDRLFSYGDENGEGLDAVYNECYFDTIRANELLTGINYKLNRFIAGNKRKEKSDIKGSRGVDKLYALTDNLERDLKVFTDSLERKYGLGRKVSKDSIDAPVMTSKPED